MPTHPSTCIEGGGGLGWLLHRFMDRHITRDTGEPSLDEKTLVQIPPCFWLDVLVVDGIVTRMALIGYVSVWLS